MLFQHNPAEPIGVWEEIREDARGLYVRGRITAAVAKAREVLSLMRAGALDGLSIGFKAVKPGAMHVPACAALRKLDLWEISVVTFPMLPGARVAAVKATPGCGARSKRTRIRTLAHAGCWADAKRGACALARWPQRLKTLCGMRAGGFDDDLHSLLASGR